jgi:hypothetical protein
VLFRNLRVASLCSSPPPSSTRWLDGPASAAVATGEEEHRIDAIGHLLSEAHWLELEDLGAVAPTLEELGKVPFDRRAGAEDGYGDRWGGGSLGSL